MLLSSHWEKGTNLCISFKYIFSRKNTFFFPVNKRKKGCGTHDVKLVSFFFQWRKRACAHSQFVWDVDGNCSVGQIHQKKIILYSGLFKYETHNLHKIIFEEKQEVFFLLRGKKNSGISFKWNLGMAIVLGFFWSKIYNSCLIKASQRQEFTFFGAC